MHAALLADMKAPEHPLVVQGFSGQGPSLMLQTTNQDGCQGNVRPAEDSGMTPSIDVNPPCGFKFYGGPGGEATQGNNKSLGYPDFCFRFPKPSFLFSSSSVSREELYSTIFNERRHLLALPLTSLSIRLSTPVSTAYNRTI